MANPDKNAPKSTFKVFNFKQFSIKTHHIGMPVSTDGVMFGAWVDIRHSYALLDIGTGSGLLTLMAAQNSVETQIFAIDIEEGAYQTAKNNQANSPWAQRLTTLHGDVLTTTFTQLFDTILCNPPYFISGEQASSPQRAMARHTETLPHEALLTRCWQLLTPTGKASFILPKAEGEAFLSQARAQGWVVTRLCEVKPSLKKPVHRLMFELSKQPHKLEQSQLTIHHNQGYSDEFIVLTKDFYLKM